MGSYHTPRTPPDWILEKIRERLAYNEKTKGLIWLVSNGKSVKAGAIAGTVNTRNGYQSVGFYRAKKFRSVKVHHIVWYLHHGEWPQAQLDHRDCDKANNSPENLRLASCGGNKSNTRAPKNNKTGFKDISLVDNNPPKPYRVRVRFNKEVRFDRHYATLDEAITARDKALLIHHGEFARTE